MLSQLQANGGNHNKYLVDLNKKKMHQVKQMNECGFDKKGNLPCKHTAFSDSLLFTLLITSDKHCQNTHHRCVMSMCVFPTCALCECMCVTPVNKACCAVAALLCVARYLSVYHTHVHENTNAWTHTRARRQTHNPRVSRCCLAEKDLTLDFLLQMLLLMLTLHRA